MPHLSGSDAEVQTVILDSDNVSGGSTDTVQIDAEEDRKIVSVQIDPENLSSANDFEGRAKVYVGTDPEVSNNTKSDIGGKLFAMGRISADSGSGQAVYTFPQHEDYGDHYFDWNEDVTLTFEVTNNTTDNLGAQAEVRYIEA